MNFLAHLYLSRNNKNILIGNFISDAIKGSKYTTYPSEIKAGILLHREIDNFTDTHPIVKKSKRRLHPRYRHYKGVIIDILYDHYLAKNWHKYSNVPLDIYAQTTYNFLETVKETLPLELQHILHYMTKNNWLVTYASVEGIGKILNGMNKQTKNISQMNLAVEDLDNLYEEFEEDFKEFFEELIQFSDKKTIELLTK